MAPRDQPPSFEEFDAKLARARGVEAPRAPQEGDRQRRPLGNGVQAGVEVVAGVVGGVAIGWALDSWTGLRPLFVILFFVLGAAAGLLNAYRHLRRMAAFEGDIAGRDGRR